MQIDKILSYSLVVFGSLGLVFLYSIVCVRVCIHMCFIILSVLYHVYHVTPQNSVRAPSYSLIWIDKLFTILEVWGWIAKGRLCITKEFASSRENENVLPLTSYANMFKIFLNYSKTFSLQNNLCYISQQFRLYSLFLEVHMKKGIYRRCFNKFNAPLCYLTIKWSFLIFLCYFFFPKRIILWLFLSLGKSLVINADMKYDKNVSICGHNFTHC